MHFIDKRTGRVVYEMCWYTNGVLAGVRLLQRKMGERGIFEGDKTLYPAEEVTLVLIEDNKEVYEVKQN